MPSTIPWPNSSWAAASSTSLCVAGCNNAGMPSTSSFDGLVLWGGIRYRMDNGCLQPRSSLILPPPALCSPRNSGPPARRSQQEDNDGRHVDHYLYTVALDLGVGVDLYRARSSGPSRGSGYPPARSASPARAAAPVPFRPTGSRAHVGERPSAVWRYSGTGLRLRIDTRALCAITCVWMTSAILVDQQAGLHHGAQPHVEACWTLLVQPVHESASRC